MRFTAFLDLSVSLYVQPDSRRVLAPVRKSGSLPPMNIACRIDTAAMQATGVCRIGPYQILEEYGFQVHLVNAWLQLLRAVLWGYSLSSRSLSAACKVEK
ncbi:MAG: hypothetical protein WCE75_07090 [Terracidiphilus sp.]